MRVFVAGGTGVIGRRLVPQLVARGHQVTATTTSPAKLGLLGQLGAEAVVMDGLDAESVREAMAAAQPDAIVNQMTALSEAHAGKPNMRRFERFFATTNRLRSEGVDNLLAAAESTGVSRVVAQSHGSFNGIRQGGWVKTEEDPLEVTEATKAITHLEDVVVKAGGAVLRYGSFYGPGASDDQVELVRKRMFPLVGASTGYSSWVHVDDAANATTLAVEQQALGVFNIVDDEPAPINESAALSREVRRGQTAAAGPRLAGPTADRRDGGGDDDRGPRLLQRQGQAGARLGAALSVLATGFQRRTQMTRATRRHP
jgi:nucleoside-diphosphate-sugar epimerase